MDFKKFIIFLILAAFVSVSFVSASWHSDTSYRDGECELFSVSCPIGYKNGGEIQHDSEVFISTEPFKFPYHSIVVREIDDEGINNLYDDYDIVDVVDNGDFKAYRTDEGVISNETVTIYSDSGHDYILKLEHKGCPYDDDQVEDDVDTLDRVANSLYRK